MKRAQANTWLTETTLIFADFSRQLPKMGEGIDINSAGVRVMMKTCIIILSYVNMVGKSIIASLKNPDVCLRLLLPLLPIPWQSVPCLVLRALKTVEWRTLARRQRNAALICTGMHIVNINALIPGGEFAPLGILLPIMRIRRNAAALAIVAPLQAMPWWTQGMG